ncbi:MAG: selenium cofactor biosynthesis protein YqeC [Candidatus Krumholzibacteriia bacterium]
MGALPAGRDALADLPRRLRRASAVLNPDALDTLLGRPAAPGDLIAVLGSGGKTTLLAALAAAARTRFPRVLVTTSTRVYPFPGLPCVDDPARLPAAFATQRTVFLGQQVEDGKLAGPDALDVDALRGLADIVLLEADGARGRPFKVHLPRDPELPAAATLALALVGASVLELPVSADSVHRLDRAPAAWELREGERPAPRQIARALLAPDGMLGKTGRVPVRMLVNQADAYPEHAAALADALTAAWAGPVLTGSAREGRFALHPTGAAPVALIVAAAGRGERFGGDKRQSALKGTPLLAWTLGAYARLPLLQRVLVLGPGDDALAADARARGWQVAVNPAPERGLSGSWRAGLAALKRDAAGALLALGDMPAPRRDTLRALLAAIAAAPGRALRPVHAGAPGHPFHVPRTLFAALAAVEGDRGGRALPPAFPLECDDPGVILDLDHPAGAAGLAALLPEEPDFHAV